MQGLELAREYYRLYGAPMLRERFPELLPVVAAGLCGAGSECFGYDDAVSRDHDLEPGFCILLPGEEVVDRRTAFLLERAYAALPGEFAGLKRGGLAPVGGARRGVLRTAEFFAEKTGTPDGRLCTEDWLHTPEQSLAEAVNGEIFYDGLGEVTAIRARLSYMPEDVRLKKLAGALLLMAQAGQYNYSRCLAHGETGAAQLAVMEFAKNAIHAAFLLNRRYMPYYKWSLRAMRALPRLAAEADTLEFLISTDNRAENAEEKAYAIEDVAARYIAALQEQQLTEAVCAELEKHAYSVQDHIRDATLRTRHILWAV